MKEQLISLETAKLAGKARYPFSIITGHKVNDTLVTNNKVRCPHLVSAPTQSLLQKWVREQYNLHIVVNIGFYDREDIGYYSNVIKFRKHHKSKYRSEFFSTYEEALEVGLIEALKLIK